jgi:uncharacterized membrane protein
MQKPARFWEIDCFRGIAIIMMIIYHTVFDLNFLHVFEIDTNFTPVWLFARMIPVIFITLVGISLVISYEKASKRLSEKQLFLKYLRRGLWIFSWGLAVTVASYLLLGEGFIVFGILHFIGLSIILAYPVLRGKSGDLLFFAGICIAMGAALLSTAFSFPYLLWLGFVPAGFHTIDYFPILPWFGFILIGIYLGREFYSGNKRRFEIREMGGNKAIRPLLFLGRHSLAIYLTHQILLLGAIYVLFLA